MRKEEIICQSKEAAKDLAVAFNQAGHDASYWPAYRGQYMVRVILTNKVGQ